MATGDAANAMRSIGQWKITTLDPDGNWIDGKFEQVSMLCVLGLINVDTVRINCTIFE